MTGTKWRAAAAALFCWAFSTTMTAAQVPGLADPAAAFGRREAIAGATLSPDGRYVAFLAPSAGSGSDLMVTDAAGGQPARLVAQSDGKPMRFQWCDWADGRRLVCQAYAVTEAYATKLAMTRLVAVDMDGTNMKALAKRGDVLRQVRLSQVDGRVVGWKRDQGAVLLMRDYVPEVTIGTRLANTRDGIGVDLLDTRTLRAQTLEVPRANVSSYLADRDGAVRIMTIAQVSAGGLLTGRIDHLYRLRGSREWKPFSTSDANGAAGLRPVAVDGTSDSAYCFQRKDGRDVLVRVSLDGSLRVETLLANASVDIDDLVRLGRDGRVIGATLVNERREVVYFDAGYAKLAANLAKALPKLPLIDFAGADLAERKLLIFAGSDVDPGRYFIYDRDTRRLNELALARPELEHVALAPVKAVRYPAADGTMIPAYLTLPQGAVTNGLPAIVMPHGGPSARDEWGFDWLAQYFALRGYAVLQPNYRGSAGYGDAWYLNNGFRSWETSIGDVVAGGRWLAGQGIADPNKLGIFGWSYGGYAALQSGVVAPGLFKAIVAVAPVTDLALVREEARGFTNARLVAAEIGSGPQIAAASPARHAEAFRAPVLLFHGTDDLNVGVAESRLMNERLRGAGKPSTLVTYPGLDHGLPDSAARADMLRKADAFLRAAMK